MGFHYPQPIFSSSIYNPDYYLKVDSSGYLTYEYAQTLYLDKNDYRLTFLSGITPGTATSGSAIVLDETLSLSGLGAVSCSALTVGGVAVGTLPTFLTGITPGTAANNKALVLGASGEIGTITSLTATSIYGSIKTADQPSITSVGTLSGLAINIVNSTTNSANMSEYALNLVNPLNTNDNQIGICFGISANLTNAYAGGASIVHKRTDLNSMGMLLFNIRNNTNRTFPLVEAFRVNSDASTTFSYPMTIDGNLSFSGASRSITGLSSISATTITGAVSGAQTGITAVGMLDALNINGNLVFSGTDRVISGLSSLGATNLNATTYKQGGVVYDLSLVNRLSLTTLGTAEASKALVLDSTSSARGVASLEINQSAILSTSSTMDAFGLILRRNSGTTGDTAGMVFATTNVSSLNSSTGGASIIFARTSGGQGIGTLSFNIRTSTATALTPLSKVLEFGIDGAAAFAYPVSAPSITLSTGGVGLNTPNIKFWNATTSLYDNFNHAYYLNVVEGGAVAQKALVVDINKDIGSIRDLDAVNINGSTKVSGTLGDFGSFSIGGASVITSSRILQNISDATFSSVVNAYLGYQLNGATLVDSSQNVFAASVLADYAQLDKTAGTAYSSTMKSNDYNLVLSQASGSATTYSGMAFHIDTSALSTSTPGACIISERNSATAYDGSSISFCTKGAAGSSVAPLKRMSIMKNGSINLGSTTSTDGDLILLKAAGSPLFRFGSELSIKNAISIQWNYAGAGLDTNRLSFDVYGTSNALAITAASRVGIGTGTPACGLDVVNYASVAMTGPLATGTSSAYSVNRSGTYTDNVSIYCREALMVGVRGMYIGSDRRVKENISTIPPEDGVKFVRDIDPKIYDLKGFDKRQLGYISQDMMQDYSALISLLPDPNMTIEQEGDVDGAFLSLSYERVPAFLHAALKSVLDRLDEQQAQIDELRAIIAE